MSKIRFVQTDLDTLLIALYVFCDDRVVPPERKRPGRRKKLSDAELICLAVAQVLLGFPSQHHWLRFCYGRLGHLFPYLPKQPGYHKRLVAATPLILRATQMLAAQVPSSTDQFRLIDATPLPCGTSRETVKRSELAGWASYGYCASHSRFFWGLRLHLVCTLHGLPVMFAVAGAKADERETLLGMLEADADLVTARPGQTLIGDKNYFGRDFEKLIADSHLALLRPVRKGEAPRPGRELFKPVRQVIESVNQTLKAQLDLEEHGGRTEDGILARILYRVLALTAAIWHNDQTGQDVKRSLIAYDH